jgi:hypothetical protein
MIKLTNLLIEIHQEQLEEGWKENILAAAIAASSIFGNAKSQTKVDNKPGTEQSVTKQSPLSVNFGTAFSSGRYLIKGETEKILVDKLEEIGKYIAKNPSSNYTIKIISSESQVPNFDAEKPGRVKLDTGELAQKRATVLNAAIKEFTNNLKQQGVLQGNVNIEIAPVLIGKEKFTSGVDNKDDSKYTKDQFVKAEVVAVPKDTTIEHFKLAGSKWETAYRNTSSVEFLMFYTTNVTTKKFEPGSLNTGYSDVLIRALIPERERIEKKISLSPVNTPAVDVANRKDLFSGEDYLIPYEVFNQTFGTQKRFPTGVTDAWEKAGYKVKVTVVNNEINVKRK